MLAWSKGTMIHLMLRKRVELKNSVRALLPVLASTSLKGSLTDQSPWAAEGLGGQWKGASHGPAEVDCGLLEEEVTGYIFHSS